MKFASIVAFAALAASAVAGSDVSIHPSVHRTLRRQGNVNIFVTMKAGTETVLNSVKEAQFPSRPQKITTMVEALEALAKESQKELDSILVKESQNQLFTSTRSYWLTNQVYIEGATFELVEKLASLSAVSAITEEEVIQLEPIDVQPINTTATILANEYGVVNMRAPEMWAKGFTGQGVVVGTIDSGVLGTHESLSSRYRSSYGWFDPQNKRAAPYDGNGHGTHTMGTITGSGGIGVAPGATWMACRGCRSSNCPQSDLLSCFQFMTCPTDTNGNNKDCSKAPQLVSNSWGGGQGSTTYDRAISAWRQAGIIPVFAIGNSGSSCRTANSPGDNANVISVGAVDSSDKLASFSSRGPAVSGRVKPEISGAGVSVRSAYNSGNKAYSSLSGTSMATPHVAGGIALLLSAKPGLKYDQIKNAITSTAKRNLPASGATCGNTADSVVPNNQYGYGRIDVLAAYNSL